MSWTRMVLRGQVWHVALVAAAGLAALAVLALVFAARLDLRPRLVSILEEQLDSDVELASFQAAFVPFVRANGTGLTIRRRDDPPDQPPLIRLGSFELTASLFGVLRRAPRISHVQLEGLEIHIPRGHDRPADADGGTDRIAEATFVIGELVGDDVRLEIATEGDPLLFAIHELRLEEFAFDRRSGFEASITNPLPRGLVRTRGTFGPWQAEAPRTTPLDGDYVFEQADLGVFGGISGLLWSNGRFGGTLEHIAATGTAKVPKFSLTERGFPIDLETSFDALIDGTNGDTILNRVEATLDGSHLEASGRIVRSDELDGRLIELDVSMEQSRLEDVIRLAVRRDPAPMQGALLLRTRLRLPPGEGDVIERLELDGGFEVRSGSFSDAGVRERLGELSRRGRGEPDAAPDRDVFSDLQGSFRLRQGVLDLSDVRFDVEGASVVLAGHYALQEGMLDLEGNLRLQAKVSETYTGIRSFFLKLVDPLFETDEAGTDLPITVSGPVDDPELGVSVGRLLRRDR